MIELMTLEELAGYLRVANKTIYRLLERRDIPAVKVGHQWRFDKSAIDAWMGQRIRGKSASILVVDDDESICALFKYTLEGAGHKVTTAGDSFAGLELARGQDYDMVFLDLKMPGMDGTEIFRQIRQVKPNLPVTIITGFPDSDLLMNALTHGPLSVVRKPFNEDDILTLVNSYLQFGVPTK